MLTNKKTIAAERHCIKDVLNSEWKTGSTLHCGRGFIYVSTRKEVNYGLQLVIIRCDRGRPFEDLDYRQEEEKSKRPKQVMHLLIPLYGNSSETDMSSYLY